MVIGNATVKQWSRTQKRIAISTQEAELYACSHTAQEALGIKAYASGLGQDHEVCVRVDSAAALSLVHREGLGKAKHVDIEHLWVQPTQSNGKLKYEKVHTHYKSADLMTKATSAERMIMLMNAMGYSYHE